MVDERDLVSVVINNRRSFNSFSSASVALTFVSTELISIIICDFTSTKDYGAGPINIFDFVPGNTYVRFVSFSSRRVQYNQLIIPNFSPS